MYQEKIMPRHWCPWGRWRTWSHPSGWTEDGSNSLHHLELGLLDEVKWWKFNGQSLSSLKPSPEQTAAGGVWPVWQKFKGLFFKFFSRMLLHVKCDTPAGLLSSLATSALGWTKPKDMTMLKLTSLLLYTDDNEVLQKSCQHSEGEDHYMLAGPAEGILSSLKGDKLL